MSLDIGGVAAADEAGGPVDDPPPGNGGRRDPDREPERDREPEPETEPDEREPLWILLGREELTSSERCRVTGCGHPISPVDVFCPDVNHADPLLFRELRVGSTRWWLVNLVRTIVVGLVVAAASYATRWPLYLLAVIVGLACIGLPLHAHRLARAVGLAGWAVVTLVAGAVAALDLGSGAMQVVWTLAVGVPLGLAMWFATQGPSVLTRDEPTGAAREAARGVASSYLMAVLTAVAWWLSSGWWADRFVDVPEVAQRWLLFAALGAALGAFLVAAIGGLVTSFGVLDLDVERRIRRLPTRRRVTWSYASRALPAGGDGDGDGDGGGRRRSLLGRHGAVLAHQLREQVKRSAVALARALVNGLLAFLHGGQQGLFQLVNWLDRRTRLFGRRLHFVTRRGRGIARTGVGYAARTVVRGGAPLVAYGAAVVGALAALGLSEDLTRYLIDGSVGRLLTGAAWSALGVAACFVMWERLSSVPPAEAVRAELRLLSRIAPDIALFTVAAGWVIGLPGTFGYGPIEIGWVTLVGTAILAVLLIQEEISERRLKRRPNGSGQPVRSSNPERRPATD